jgi:outer membrane receptor for ferrienterochelin and colicins
LQAETGYTVQHATYWQPVAYAANLPAQKQMLRTPQHYGYYTFAATQVAKFSASVSGVYTGPMLLLHLSGAYNNPNPDHFVNTQPFFEHTLKIGYTATFSRIEPTIEFFAGVKNVFNAFQNNHDQGPNRDSNFVYGPALPRTLFAGIKLASF